MNRRVRRRAVNLFLILYLPVLFIDAMPVDFILHRMLKEAIDPVVDVTGTWQGSWALFSPDIDKENTFVSAEVRFADGAVAHWRSPVWSRASMWERFRLFRHMEYYDKIRLDANQGAWESLARYLALEVKHPQGHPDPVTEVVLIRHWATIPPPPTHGDWPPAEPYVHSYRNYRFYVSEGPW